MHLLRSYSLSSQVRWRVTVLSVIAIVGLLTAVVMATIIAILHTQEITHHVSHDVNRTLANFLVQVETDVKVTASNYGHTSVPDTLLKDLLDRNDAILRVGVLDDDNNIINSRQRVGLVDEAALITQVERHGRRSGWGDVYINERNLPQINLVALEGHTSDGLVEPILMIAVIDLTGLWDVVRNVQFGIGGYAYLVDENNQLLVAPNIGLVQDSPVSPAYLSDYTHTHGSAFNLNYRIHAGLNGEPILARVDHLVTIPWALVLEQPVTGALRGLYPVAAVSIALLIAVNLVVSSTARFMYQRVVVPLNILRNDVEQFRVGNLNHRIHLKEKSNDEIENLASTFNSMAHNIQQRTEELEIARADALESSRLKSEFLSTVSHELRTPLNAIMGYCDLLLEGLAGKFDDETRRMLGSIDQSSNRLLNLINNLLDLSRIESGKIVIEQIQFDVRAVARDVYEEHALTAQGKGLEFTVTTDPALPEVMYSDPTRLNQIITNLVTNAIKFTETGSVTVNLEKRRAEWTIIVKDTGIGIPEHASRYIFESFRQVDASTTRLYGGTGLGLSIVSNLTALMGGRLTLESEEAAGSTFTVCLPLITEPTAPPGEEVDPVSAAPGASTRQ